MPTVLITGASRGIGRGFVDRFNEAGWRVIVPDLLGFGTSDDAGVPSLS